MSSKLLARSGQRDIASLDVLRGIAILFVIAAHFAPGFSEYHAASIACANAGVILFFFLSGFLMDRAYSADPRLFPYAIRRSFRILPMYWVSIASIFLIEGTWSLRDALANATFTTQIMHVTRMSGVYWTLYIEVLFYAIVPILWMLGRRSIYSAPFILMGAFAVARLTGNPLPNAPFYLVYCLTGMLFGAWHRNKLSDIALAASLVAIAIGSSVLPTVSPFLGLAPLMCGLLLYVALRFPFQFLPMDVVGRVSYSWYLLHSIFGYRVEVVALSYGYSQWFAALIGIAASFALSAITFICVEDQAQNAGKRFAQRKTVAAFASN